MSRFLHTQYAVQVFADRADFSRLTGQACPPYDETKRKKRWCVPAPPDKEPDEYVTFTVLAVDQVGRPLSRDGKPYLKQIGMTVEEAASVNIAYGLANELGVPLPEWQPPLLPLREWEYLGYDAMGPFAEPVIRNVAEDASKPAQWTTVDAALLRAIAAKVGA